MGASAYAHAGYAKDAYECFTWCRERNADPQQLHKSLKNRHIQLIALGGAIGTGLFYGSSESIALAGPSILLAYVIGGAAIFVIVRAMSEMSVEEPKAGAFSYYASRYWSKRAGFISGWNYWFNYVLVSMVELAVVGPSSTTGSRTFRSGRRRRSSSCSSRCSICSV